MIEILSFINTVTLVQFWLTFFLLPGTKAKLRTVPSYAWAVLKMKLKFTINLKSKIKLVKVQNEVENEVKVENEVVVKNEVEVETLT